MSSDKDQTAPPPVNDDSAAGPAAEGAAEQQSGAAPRRRGRGPAWLALLLALVALAVAAWVAWPVLLEDAETADARALAALEDQLREQAELVVGLQSDLAEHGQASRSRTEQVEQRLEARIESRFGRVADLERAVGRIEARSEDLPARLDALERELADRTQDSRELRERLDAAIRQLDERGDLERQVDRDLRRQIVMLEAAGLLRSGQDLAELAGDHSAALRAFRRARTRLGALEDARLEQVQRSLAREIEDLAAARAPDLHSALAVLERLGRDSQSWPLQLEPAPVASPEESPEDWRQRVGATLRSLVRIQARDELGRTQETFEAAREQLRLRLLTAELALARRESETLVVQIDAALALLDEWFRADAEAVRSARAELERLRELSLTVESPALGVALEQLEARLAGS